MHQSDRVLRQFGCRQSIPVEPEVFDDEHKIDLRQFNTDWPRYWSGYIQMWEDRYDYIPTQEPIIVPELACMPKYMPWFKIHGKPYLLSAEERQRQLPVQRERRGPLNLRRKDNDAGPSTGPKHSPDLSSAAIQSPSPTRAPTQSPDPVVQPTIPMAQPFQMMPGAFPSPFMYLNPYMFPFPSPMAGWSQWHGSLHFLLCREDRRCIGQRGTRDRKRGRRGALLFTNPHHRMCFKHRCHW
ncbi:serine/threonine-protein phosphatase 7 long form homolog [Gossypium raimondii]|uniref:serine/threonine-protein phosphatase 7 long form homolog n=1 Tax=Gossypium raimondii TaxID=29730 RepID=UPI00227D2A36|nr:serine/threonine-protein phosphatase 7 long form homolog [Gossypium raimondii]